MKKKIPLKRILKYISPHAWMLVLVALSSLIYSLCALAVPVVVGKSIDCFVGVGQVNFELIKKYLIAIACFAIVGGGAKYIEGVAANRLAFVTVRDVRNDIIQKIQKLPLVYFDNTPSGITLNAMVADAEALSDGVIIGFTQLFSGVLGIVGTLILMLLYSPIVALVVVVLTPLSLIGARVLASKTHAQFTEQGKKKADLTSFIEETVRNNKTIKAYEQENEMARKFREKDEDLRKTALKATFLSSLVNPTTRFVNSVVYASVALLGALRVCNVIAIGEALTAGGLACLLNYAGQFAKPFNEISGVIAELQSSAVGANRIFNLLDQEEQPTDEGNAVLECQGKVEMENVSFSYSKDKKLIQDLSFCVEKGKHVAIVGPTGCGKTTLINLLMRFYDVNKGKVAIDGLDVKDVTRNSLHEGWGMVLQESWIRNDTMRENLTFGKNIDDETIFKAAKICNFYDYIKRSGGLDAVITDESLSQGEKQLLCITRVMLSEPKMLILDEATSAVDIRTEVNINTALDTLMKGKTSFIVAHRLSTIKTADMIFVMQNGDVIGKGTHDELLGSCDFYRRLYYGLVD